ncbi:hypothetical protein ACI2I2_09945 [Scandinavium sp. NPDC088450]|uniref:hypothetical protein n=1 Tax=Scandinavium sp. NPDC088450 TaxID=3364514 RepID=UPI00384F0694
MTASRSIFAFIKSPLTMLFLAGFIVAIIGSAVYAWFSTPLTSQCISPVSFYAIKDDENVTLTRGTYRTFREGLNKGRITFTGSIAHFSDDKPRQPPIPVQREVQFEGEFSGNLLHMTVTGHHRRLGDQSSDQDVTDNIFPQISNGETGTTSLYILDGKVLATGTETVARVACID